MALFKCKMCGGALEINNETVATCEYCGTTQTLPRIDDERKANLYDRANHFRRNNEFDKAMGIYEQILNDDNTDSEAYWALVLCSYGIEYVEDPAAHKRVPTVNRAQYTSVFDDDNYKSALQYADSFQKSIYEQEAAAINEIQKDILAISQKEEPFDVFICYKETDNSGRRTPDSVLANDLYHQLTQEGFKVFFARITLEDKLGSAYEPYIFAALNSAKVMVALGTKPEYFNAVWVKNEWSRYLSLIKNGAKKMLIPAYKDMDPYDLPEEFSHLQAQDMSKLGFMQDLIRGIKKIMQTDAPNQTTVVKETVIAGGNANTEPLLKRAFMFIEDGDWDSADAYCEKVLDIDPENAVAYLGKLLSELKIKRKDSLKEQFYPFDKNNNYQKIVRFGDDELKNELKGYLDVINERNETARKDRILAGGKSKMCNGIPGCEEAIKLFESIPGWKDADEQIVECRRLIEKMEAEIAAKWEASRLALARLHEIELKKSEKRKRIATLSAVIIGIIGVFLLILIEYIIPNERYNNAIALMEEEKYGEAFEIFVELDDFEDSELYARYARGLMIVEEGKYEEAYEIFDELGDYRDSKEKADLAGYNCAVIMMESGNYAEAMTLFKSLGSYGDSADRLEFLKLNNKNSSLQVGSSITLGRYNGESIVWTVLEREDDKLLVISRDVLENRSYGSNTSNTSWVLSGVRSWLNKEFLKTAFSNYETEIILPVDIKGNYSTVRDRIFLLSDEEAEKYFDSNNERKCESGGLWLLRDGDYVSSDGYIVNNDESSTGGVRPAMWIAPNPSN